MKLLLAVAAVVVVAVAVAVYAVTRPAPVAAVHVTAADAAAAERKAATLEAAAALASRTGRPVHVSEVFTDAELTALANQQLAGGGQPVESVALRSNPAGYVEGTAQAQVAGQALPVYFHGRLVASPSRRPQLEISDTRVGAVALPGAISDQVTAALAGGVDLGSVNVQDLQVAYGDGSLTLSGTVLPA